MQSAETRTTSATPTGADATSDGLLITRFNRGLAGAALIASTRKDQTPANLPATSASITAHMDTYAGAHDVDGNGSVNLTDALIITRYLAGFRGPALTSGLTLSGTRTSAPDIEAYIAQGCPNAGTTSATETLSYLHPNVSGSPIMVRSSKSCSFPLARASAQLQVSAWAKSCVPPPEVRRA